MAEKSKQTTVAEEMDVTSSLRTLKKWLKSLKVKTDLTVSGNNIPPGLKHGILFLDYLRCTNFPQAVTASEECILKVMADLHGKTDQESGSSSGEPADQKSKKTNAPNKINPRGKAKNGNQENNKEEQKPNQKAVGPKRVLQKLAPLSEAMNKLNIQDKGCGCKGECKTKNCGCRKRDVQCCPSCKCSEGCVNKIKKVENKQDIEETEETEENTAMNEDSSDSATSGKSDADSSSDEEDVEKVFWEEENVDWNKHIASLVKCPKCTRNFHPSRVEYHAKVCKNH